MKDAHYHWQARRIGRRARPPPRPRDSGRGRLGFLPVLLLEALDAAGRVDELLLTGEERMADRADLDGNFLLARARRPGLAAGANHFRLFVLRMNVRFHLNPPP